MVEHRGRGVEHLRADLRAVEGRLVEAHARHVEDGGGDRLRHGEGLLECGRGVLAARDETLRERGLLRRAERGHGAVGRGPGGVRAKRLPAGQVEAREERVRFLHGGVKVVGHDLDLDRVLAHDEPRRDVAETQVAPVVDVAAVEVARLSVHAHDVLRHGGVHHLHVFARLRSGERKLVLKRNLALLALRRRDPLRAGKIDVGTRLGRGADPLRLPVGRLHHAHRELGGLRPVALLAVVAPGLDLPEHALRRGERRAGIGHTHGLRARDLTGIPQVALVGVELGA